jgi:hypothetical protein
MKLRRLHLQCVWKGGSPPVVCSHCNDFSVRAPILRRRIPTTGTRLVPRAPKSASRQSWPNYRVRQRKPPCHEGRSRSGAVSTALTAAFKRVAEARLTFTGKPPKFLRVPDWRLHLTTHACPRVWPEPGSHSLIRPRGRTHHIEVARHTYVRRGNSAAPLTVRYNRSLSPSSLKTTAHPLRRHLAPGAILPDWWTALTPNALASTAHVLESTRNLRLTRC